MKTIKLLLFALLLTSCRIYVIMPSIEKSEQEAIRITPQYDWQWDHYWQNKSIGTIFDTLLFDGDTLLIER